MKRSNRKPQTTAREHTVCRFRINENTVASVAFLPNFSQSVILVVNGKLQHHTEQTFLGADERHTSLLANDYIETLYKSIMGQPLPLRYFRDNNLAR